VGKVFLEKGCMLQLMWLLLVNAFEESAFNVKVVVRVMKFILCCMGLNGVDVEYLVC
jgi:hypothetical protein